MSEQMMKAKLCTFCLRVHLRNLNFDWRFGRAFILLPDLFFLPRVWMQVVVRMRIFRKPRN